MKKDFNQVINVGYIINYLLMKMQKREIMIISQKNIEVLLIPIIILISN